jgi:hypothetical protein
MQYRMPSSIRDVKTFTGNRSLPPEVSPRPGAAQAARIVLDMFEPLGRK